MCGMVHIGGKVPSILEAAEKMNVIGLDAGDFSEAMNIFNLEFPLEFAKMNTDGCKGAILGLSQDLTESEAI